MPIVVTNPALTPAQARIAADAPGTAPCPTSRWDALATGALPLTCGTAAVEYVQHQPHLLPVLALTALAFVNAAYSLSIRDTPAAALRWRRYRRAVLPLVQEYGPDLRVTDADVAAAPGAVAGMHRAAGLVQRAERLEAAGTAGTGFAPGEVLRTVRAEAWQAALLLREAARIHTQLDQCPEPDVRDVAHDTATELSREAGTRLVELALTLERLEVACRNGSSAAVLSAVARGRDALQASAAHHPGQELSVLAEAAAAATRGLAAGGD